MARATVAEIDKRLSAHEAACEVRWRENWRRLETIETEGGAYPQIAQHLSEKLNQK